MTKKTWKDLSAGQRQAIFFGSGMQFGLLVAALIDIYRRPRETLRGNRILWTVVSFVNFVGPLAYFLFGRKRPQAA